MNCFKKLALTTVAIAAIGASNITTVESGPIGRINIVKPPIIIRDPRGCGIRTFDPPVTHNWLKDTTIRTSNPGSGGTGCGGGWNPPLPPIHTSGFGSGSGGSSASTDSTQTDSNKK